MGKRLLLTESLLTYLLNVSLREAPILRRLREETALLPQANMQVPPEEGQFLGFLGCLMGAQNVLEVGVFTGYSSLAIATALPTCHIVACDISEEWTTIARRYWDEAGVADRIDLRLGAALQTLDELLREPGAATFDLAFIDADKEHYLDYYERALQLVRPGGLIAIDNVLWDGNVADSAVQDSETQAVRAFNERLYADTRIDLSLVPVADGLTLARKRG